MELAVIKTGGKQYKIKPGKKIKIEKIGEFKEGDKIEFPEVLLLADNNNVAIGKPRVENAKVIGRVLRNFRGNKITILKYKSKTRRKVKKGHRQNYIEVEITEIK